MAAINHPLGRESERTLPRPGFLPWIRVNWWVLSALILIGSSAMLPVIQTSTATTTGFEIEALQAERARLSGEIASLEAEVAELRSMDRIEERARELGLEPADEPVYVKIDEAGPSPAKLPAQYHPGPLPEPRVSEPWWQVVFEALPFAGE